MQLDIDGGRQSPFEDNYSDYDDLDFQFPSVASPPCTRSASPTSAIEVDGVPPLVAPAAQRLTYCLTGEKAAHSQTLLHYDLDGGRQSPFSDYDDYDYDSCCGAPGTFDVGWSHPALSSQGAMIIADGGTGKGDPLSTQPASDTEMFARIMDESYFSSDRMASLESMCYGRSKRPLSKTPLPSSKNPRRREAGRQQQQQQAIFQGVPWRFGAAGSDLS
mmetsp:Transcript_4752/g.11487  ORF Transcript_4752/g.11487 Transcript_4752/m.11487 type:complete len:218 (-) Transcript_4752:181-834(-)